MTELELLAGFGLTLALQSTLLLGLAALVDRIAGERHPRLAESAWRGALFAAIPIALLTVAFSGATPERIAAASPAVPTSTSIAATAPGMSERHPTASPARTVPASRPSTLAAAPSDVSPASDLAARIQLHPALGAATLLLWLSAAGVLSLRLLWQLAAMLVLRLSGPRAAVSTDLRRLAEGLSAELALPPPRLWLSAAVPSPLALPFNAIVLPAWVETLTARQQRALLAHELGHLQRGDPARRIAQRLLMLPLCWQPLAWIAQRRLDALAERACDAVAARVLGSGRPLAECLAACLRHSTPTRLPRLAVAMAAGDSDVVRRARRLLKENPMSLYPLSRPQRHVLVAAGATLASLLIATGGIGVSTPARAGISSSIEIETTGGHASTMVSVQRDGYRLKIGTSGRIRFADDERSVTAMDDGARLQVEETRDGVERELELRARGGRIEREYRVDGDEHPFDDAAEAWFATLIPELYRRSGLDAERRVQRLLDAGGADAALAEIARIESGHVRGLYLQHLFAQATLTPAQVQQALQHAASMASDHERRTTLAAMLEAAPLPSALRPQLFGIVAGIESDYERAELLLAVAHLVDDEAATLEAWANAVDGIESDYERRRVLEGHLGRDASAAALSAALRLAAAIDSDYEKRVVLQQAAARVGDGAIAQQAFLQVARSIGSDYERRVALEALASGASIDTDVARGYIDAAATIGSDYERRVSLVALARVMPADAELIAHYRAAARSLGGHERGEAERALDRFAVL